MSLTHHYTDPFNVLKRFGHFNGKALWHRFLYVDERWNYIDQDFAAALQTRSGWTLTTSSLGTGNSKVVIASHQCTFAIVTTGTGPTLVRIGRTINNVDPSYTCFGTFTAADGQLAAQADSFQLNTECTSAATVGTTGFSAGNAYQTLGASPTVKWVIRNESTGIQLAAGPTIALPQTPQDVVFQVTGATRLATLTVGGVLQCSATLPARNAANKVFGTYMQTSNNTTTTPPKMACSRWALFCDDPPTAW